MNCLSTKFPNSRLSTPAKNRIVQVIIKHGILTMTTRFYFFSLLLENLVVYNINILKKSFIGDTVLGKCELVYFVHLFGRPWYPYCTA